MVSYVSGPTESLSQLLQNSDLEALIDMSQTPNLTQPE